MKLQKRRTMPAVSFPDMDKRRKRRMFRQYAKESNLFPETLRLANDAARGWRR